jgi:protein TonB
MKKLILSILLLGSIIQSGAQGNLVANNNLCFFDNTFEPPVFSTQNTTLTDFIQANLYYPDLAIEHGIEGEVVVLVHLQADGKVESARVISGIGFNCDEEVIRLIMAMPYWEPAILGGTPVASKVKIKVRFRLR